MENINWKLTVVNKSLTLDSIMSAQLLIYKFAVFTLFLPMARMSCIQFVARWLAVRQAQH